MSPRTSPLLDPRASSPQDVLRRLPVHFAGICFIIAIYIQSPLRVVACRGPWESLHPPRPNTPNSISEPASLLRTKSKVFELDNMRLLVLEVKQRCASDLCQNENANWSFEQSMEDFPDGSFANRRPPLIPNERRELDASV